MELTGWDNHIAVTTDCPDSNNGIAVTTDSPNFIATQNFYDAITTESVFHKPSKPKSLNERVWYMFELDFSDTLDLVQQASPIETNVSMVNMAPLNFIVADRYHVELSIGGDVYAHFKCFVINKPNECYSHTLNLRESFRNFKLTMNIEHIKLESETHGYTLMLPHLFRQQPKAAQN